MELAKEPGWKETTVDPREGHVIGHLTEENVSRTTDREGKGDLKEVVEENDNRSKKSLHADTDRMKYVDGMFGFVKGKEEVEKVCDDRWDEEV